MTLLTPSLSSMFLEDYFYRKPAESKPPVSYEVFQDDPVGVRIQFAVAGYRKEDLSVEYKGTLLEVSGDNSQREDVNNRYKSKFHKTFSMSEYADLESSSVKFFDGILEIFVPVLDTKKSYKKLLIS